MSALHISHRPAPAAPYGTVHTFLEVLDELPVLDRQRAAVSFLQRLPDPEVAPDTLPIRKLLLALLDLSIIDGVILDFDTEAQPIGLSVRHLRRLVDAREDAEQRLAIASHHVRQDDLSKLFDDIASEAQSAGNH